MNNSRRTWQHTPHRWPKAECLHEDTSGPDDIVNGFGQLIRTIPERCLDCGAKRAAEGWQ